LAHQDVVPVEPGTEARWTEPPFGGSISDGYVWGRGALDDKDNLLGILEAVETLVGQSFHPQRSVYLAFGADEEVGGTGAKAIAALLASRNVHPAFIVDEGGAIMQGLVRAVPGPVALVGIAEKGYISVELTVHAPGGHSSMPPAETPELVLAHVRATIRDPRVDVRRYESFLSQPSPVSDVGSPNFRLLERTIRQVAPEAVVVPWLVVGGTDARHYTGLTPDVYRFSAARMGAGDLERVHGTNERLAVASYGQVVQFYV